MFSWIPSTLLWIPSDVYFARSSLYSFAAVSEKCPETPGLKPFCTSCVKWGSPLGIFSHREALQLLATSVNSNQFLPLPTYPTFLLLFLKNSLLLQYPNVWLAITYFLHIFQVELSTFLV